MLLLVVIAVCLRVIPQWPVVIEGGSAVISDPDACYHLRRAELMAAGSLATFDRFLNHPHGAHIIWPPLYDLVLAGALLVLPASSPLLAILPPLLFGLTAAALWAFARRQYAGGLQRLIAAGVPVMLPAALPYTTLGQLDHHAAELLLVCLFMLALTVALEQLGQGYSPLRCSVAPALVLAAGLAVQLSLVVLLVVAALALAWDRQTWKRSGPALVLRCELAASMLGLALLPLLPLSLVYLRDGAPFSHAQFGLFQPALLTAGSLLFLVIRLAAAPLLRLGTRPLPRSLVLSSAVLALAVLAVLLVWLVPEVLAGAGFVAGSSSPWLSHIGESRSLLAGPLAASCAEISSRLSLLVVGLPVALLLWIRSAVRGNPGAAVLVSTSLVLLPMALLQARFVPHLSLLIGCAAVTTAQLGRARPWGRGRVRAAVILVVVMLAMLPTRREWQAEEQAALAFAQARPVLDYLARQAPPAGADRGVLAEWSYGHFIQYHGRHPAVADNFGDHAGSPALVRDILLDSDEDRVLARLRQLSVRYVLVADLAPTFGGLLPRQEDLQRFVAGGWDGSGGSATIRFTPAILDTVLYRLSRHNGSGVLLEREQRWVPALRHLRLVAESSQLQEVGPDRRVALVKLYEVVRGVSFRLYGLPPAAHAGIVASVTSPQGQRFPFLVSRQAGPDGTLQLTLPYPSGRPGIENGELWIGEQFLPLPVISERDIDEGRVITLAAPGS